MDFKTIYELFNGVAPWVNFNHKKFYHPQDVYLGFSIISKKYTELPRLIGSFNNLLKEKVDVASVDLVSVIFDYDGREFAEVDVFKFNIKERGSDGVEKAVWVPNSIDDWHYKHGQYHKVLLSNLNIHDDVHMYLRHIGVYPK
ncbi:hypothetical protein KTH46_07635 [Acinetobacter bereziniae]|uniref:hypothetical protein n=1 Tax=Acinetobacter bereziniae TaxID=106648 RepID=UPI0021D2B7CD|nr:hypothetical protein [Acinetobacter bereziniae]MCU4314893.1 hypothetical protein [Acinetobacter bereziniae]